MRIGFDNDKYIDLQARHIRERVDQFGGKLYLEFGGKLFDDYHASRVLPGFEPDSKIRMLKSMADDVEIILVINANHIEKSKVRGDLGITYDDDTLRLMDIFRTMGFAVNGVVITHYANQPAADAFRKRLDGLGVKSYLHYPIAGYPYDIDRIVSDDGLGRNDFVETTRPLVVVTAPGPGSGKMATCLSQLYHENKRGVNAGYAKYETFPIWNLPLKHPANIAYEAATADLDDANIIDPFHLEAYDERTVNYNRDVEIFPVLKTMLDRISGSCPYQSPTDMGVNMAGLAISDDNAVCEAARMEIVRRYFQTAVDAKRTGDGEERVGKIEMLMSQAGIDQSFSPARSAALLKEETTGSPAGAMVLPDGTVITGKTSTLLGAASTLLMNALKALADVEDVDVITDEVIEPICRLKTEHLRSQNPRLHSDETLMAVAVSSGQSELAARLMDHVDDLRGCDAFFSVIISSADEKLYRTLGINVCCEPKYEQHRYYHK
ncbi:DUF1846 domain-containing protein [Xiamenia xianingshaonis]|uniref:DUF1846 domain-containing protein n=1 Tax=Xiamenia xianingshaonis TaxID=2682776 RepID=A0A9E6SUT1_9ACTN|nr:DUF1846 domain-containing protein [Xiamenia xianingshaonis]NGM18095.1 DUF1846 family protein [Eggerthellaceae bacterium zg-893]NHM14851.1 DUF1846 family protein [Xiamenia xianingshaonis]NHM15467.1 DUF1846 family protein [Xiamenia xianingshaonis]QTU84744.1 DUF1846 domain-containing protein [Xiamenia xianingshaonis]